MTRSLRCDWIFHAPVLSPLPTDFYGQYFVGLIESVVKQTVTSLYETFHLWNVTKSLLWNDEPAASARKAVQLLVPRRPCISGDQGARSYGLGLNEDSKTGKS